MVNVPNPQNFLTVDSFANKSPSGLLTQVSLTSASPASILTADTAIHVNRIHIDNPSTTDSSKIVIYHVLFDGTSAANQNIIFRTEIATETTWIFEAPALGSTISLARKESIWIASSQTCGCSIYGHSAER